MSIITPVEVSLWVSAYVSTSGFARGSGCVPTGDSSTSGSSRNGAAAATLANCAENSPKAQCWLRRSIRPNVAASQNAVVPPLPSSTS